MNINYFPISFEFNKYQINVENYSPDRLKDLRENHNTTHSFFRNSDSIYISNSSLLEDSFVLGNTVTRSVMDDAEITSSLIKHVFFRTFKERFPGYIPVEFYPFKFFSAQDKDNIIQNALPEDLRDKLAYKKLIEVQIRQSEINGKKQVGFVINIRRNWIFNKSCKELYQEGFNLVGTEVVHSEILPGLNGILGPSEDFIGVIESVDNEKAGIQTNEGYREIDLEELFIRKTKFNIANYLTFRCGEANSEAIFDIIDRKRNEILNPKNQYNEIKNIGKRLFVENGLPILFKNSDGFCFWVENSLLNVRSSIDLKAPTFIYDYASTHTSNKSSDFGLTTYGPYDSITFDTKLPEVLCICNKNNRGHFANFLSNLKEGIPHSNYFVKGLQKKYDLQDIHFSISEILTFSLEEYYKIIRDYDGIKPHLAIIEIPSEFKQNSDISNPYYQIKGKLLSLEIPVQFVTTEKIKKHDEYILNSLALQIYAKIGGTPWVLPTQRSVDREIVIGIGHSILRENKFKGAKQSRVVGITTFLSSDGQYLLGEKVKDVSFEDYFEELLNSLRQSIEKLSVEQGWNKGETVRLIFHIFKPIRNTEFDVIALLVKEIASFKIQFAFVTISKHHPFLLFDTTQGGISHYGDLKGEYVPVRGSNVILDDETSIVQMFGPKELKTSKQGISNPIQIKIRTPKGNYKDESIKALIFYDLSYITQQIFSFTYLSWRSFLPGEQPATMMYSELIAKLLGKMRNVSGWDPDKLNYSLKRKKWFL